MAFKKILVALDGLDRPNMIFQEALDLAQKEQSQLMLFHVIPDEIETVTDLYLYGNYQVIRQKFLDEETKNVKIAFQAYYQEAAEKNIPCEFDCKVGHAGFLICELARLWGADLILVGRRGHAGLAEIILGSVSNYVLHHAACSVLVVQGFVPRPNVISAPENEIRMSV